MVLSGAGKTDSLIENLPVGFAYHQAIYNNSGQPEDYVFLIVNRAFEEMTGLKREAVIGKKVTEVLPGIKDDPHDWINTYGQLAAGGSGKKVFEQYSQPLSRWYEVTVYSDDQGYFSTMFLDITERKKQLLSMERFRRTFDNISEGCQIISTDFRYLYVNGAAAAQGGRPGEELIGRTMMDCYPGIDKTEMFHTLRYCMESGQPRRFDNFFSRPDGSSAYFELSIQPIPEGIFILSVDVTARKQAETKLLETTRELEGFFDVALDLLSIADTDGNFVKVNRAWADILGYNPAELERKKFLEFVHPEDMAATYQAIAELSKEQEVVDFTNRYRTKDGSYRYIEWRARPRGNIIYSAARDITDRKLKEDALRASEKKYRSIIRAAINVSLIVTDLNTAIMEFSPGAEQIFGYRKEEVIGKHVGFLHEEEEARNLPEYIEKLHQNREGFSLETKLIRKSGEVFTALFNLEPLFDAEGNLVGTLGISIDISHRKRAEAKLLESEEKYRILVENLNEGVWQIDGEGRTVYVNQRMADILGYTVEEMIGRHFFDFADERGRRIAEENIKRRAEGISEQHDAELLRKDGQRVIALMETSPVIDVHGNYQGAIAGVLDITDRKRAEEELRAGKQQLDMFFSQSLNGFFFMMLEEPVQWDESADKDKLLDYIFAHQHLTRVNQAMLDQYGAREEDFLGLTPGDFFSHDPEQGRSIWRGLFDKGRWQVETREQKLDGTPVIIDGDYICLYDDRGRITGHFGVQTDITVRKEAEEALQAKSAELKRSNEDLEQFAYAISHDMRQPLRMVGSYLQLLETEISEMLNEETMEYFNYARDGARRMDQMIMALLDFSRVGRKTGGKAEINSREALDEAIFFLEPEIKESGAEIIIEGEWPRIFASQDEMTRLFQNLLGNAIKYQKDGQTPLITVRVQPDGERWLFSITDNGIGIDPAQTDRLFKVFSRLHARTRYAGTGVGLALCRRIIEHHHGRIWVESPGESRGSTFYFII